MNARSALALGFALAIVIAGVAAWATGMLPGKHLVAGAAAMGALILWVAVRSRAVSRWRGRCAICGHPSDRYLCDECHQLEVW